MYHHSITGRRVDVVTDKSQSRAWRLYGGTIWFGVAISTCMNLLEVILRALRQARP
jgi:hypothetical protein